MSLTTLGSAAEVLVATGHDPFARGSLRRPIARGWLAGRAVAWMGIDGEEHVSYLNSLGPPAEVAALLADLLPELPPKQRLTVPRGTPAHLPAWVAMDGTDWDLRWLGAPPPEQPGEERVEPVDDDTEVAALLRESSPTASALPGDPAVRGWVGIREGGALIACAADTSAATGVGHLSSIAVHPAARGRNLGAVVTAALSRQLLEAGSDIVTLGMYADNAYGRAMYDRLGFADEHHFTSGPLLVRGRW
jgi:ribosomal protein S18 acetylase RimI-like enzyme